LPTFARQKCCLTGLTLTNGQTSMHSVNPNMAGRLLQEKVGSIPSPWRSREGRLIASSGTGRVRQACLVVRWGDQKGFLAFSDAKT
jgi:hypothetical protein